MSSKIKTTFLVPDFNEYVEGKVDALIDVISRSSLRLLDSQGRNRYQTAVATHGFSSDVDGM